MKETRVKVNCHKNIHARPAALLLNLRKRFPQSQFRMFRAGMSETEAVRFDSIFSFMAAEFKDGDELVLEVDGGR